ncbi:unnamed protein product, partial [Discosporangium mesarthrocarpum]
VRSLAAEALHNLVPLEPGYLEATVLPGVLGDALHPDAARRHGTCLVVAEVTLALTKVFRASE